MAGITRLADRSVVAITGDQRRDFLQGLVSNNVPAGPDDGAVFAALLTPQGKFLHDFFLLELDGALLTDVAGSRADDLIMRLRRYRLRTKVDITLRTDLCLHAVMGDPPAADWPATPGATRADHWSGAAVRIFRDPRHGGMGWRVLAPVGADPQNQAGLHTVDGAAHDAHRMGLGLPEGTRDLVPEKSTLLEAGYDDLNAIAWDKGCYLGQELTARMRYRGLVKKRLLPIGLEAAPGADRTVRDARGRAVGDVRSWRDGDGIALLRLDALEDNLSVAEGPVRVRLPDWVNLSG